MTTSAWTDVRRPSAGNHVLRDDGRICVVKAYIFVGPIMPQGQPRTSGPLIPSEIAPYVPAPRTQRGAPMPLSDLPPTMAGSLLDHPHVEMRCGDKVAPRIVSMNTFWPCVTTDSATCEGCCKTLP
jgi:hypothetical protein